MVADVEPLRKAVSCPNCSLASARTYYPFCSKRCSEMDLHRWFSGGYVLASQEQPFAEEE
ncbi:MAG: DNA gyrase inhibitor YacG [Rhizobiaceae bacterium]|nr:DNA gyrase inhibitor YacG [Rhizobiaceae bacterium]